MAKQRYSHTNSVGEEYGLAKGEPLAMTWEDLDRIKTTLSSNHLSLLNGYFYAHSRFELASGRQPINEQMFWLRHVVGRRAFLLMWVGMPTDEDMAGARAAARAAWGDIVDEKRDAIVVPRTKNSVLNTKPTAPRRLPPPAPKIDDGALLEQMRAMLMADPSLSVWKAADMLASRAPGNPRSSDRSRRARLIGKYNRRWPRE
jgi:hypothetical protein